MSIDPHVAVPEHDGRFVDPTDVIALHDPDLARARVDLLAAVGAVADTAPLRHELLRLRVAEATGCEYCRNVRYRPAVEAGLTEDLVARARGTGEAGLSPRDAEALALAEGFLGHGTGPDEPCELAADEVAGVVVALVARLTGGKVMVALGLVPDDMEMTVL